MTTHSQPDDNYLLALGKVVYAVASLEGLLLFDLPRSPSSIDVGKLAGLTTGQLGEVLTAEAQSLPDSDWTEYLQVGGNALTDITAGRNGIFHSRPATNTSENDVQQLYRWNPGRQEYYFVTLEVLEAMYKRVTDHRQQLGQLRPSFDSD